MAIALSNCMCLVSMSCFIFSLHFWLFFLISPPEYGTVHHCYWQPLLLPILDTCPNHVSFAVLGSFLSIHVLSWCRVLRTVPFLIFSRFNMLNSLCSHVIPALKIVFFSITSILSHTTKLELRRFRIGLTLLCSYLKCHLPAVVCRIYQSCRGNWILIFIPILYP